METKRITLLCGHYGSGKTNIAVNLATALASDGKKVAVADLDIVNPYFRTKDSEDLFKSKGIRLICSDYANTNLDIPALPQDMYAVTDDKSYTCVLDIGGDDRGALVLGRLAPKIVEENDYEMIFVVNFFRPLTPDVEDALEVMAEIEAAGHIKFSAIINNSNIGKETTAADVLATVEKVERLAKVTGLKVVATTVKKELMADLSGKIENLYSLELQKSVV